MTFVERIYPGFQWADPLQNNELVVDWIGSELKVTGRFPFYRINDSSCDLIHQYEDLPVQLAKSGVATPSPEICFANADTDEKLIAFVRRFGPVVAKSVQSTFPTDPETLGDPFLLGRLIAQQDMQELRNEQEVYRASLALVNQLDQTTHNYISIQHLMQAMAASKAMREVKFDNSPAEQLKKIIGESATQQLNRPNRVTLSVRQLLGAIAQNTQEQLHGSDYVSAQQLLKMITASIKEHLERPIYDYFAAQKLIKTIAANVQDWPRQWDREKAEREKLLAGSEPTWKLSAKSLVRIQSLSSQGPDWLLPDELSGRIVICELLNVFPSMIFPNPSEMHSSIKFGIRPLLYAILSRQFTSPRGYSACQNTECRNFFNIERTGQQFCSPECSRRYRQRVYWQERGSKLRAQRSTRRSRPIK